MESGHTAVYPSRDAFDEWILSQKSLPVDVELRGKRLYVTTDKKLIPEESFRKLSSREKELYEFKENAEIVKIDDWTIEEWMDKIGVFVSSDENHPAFKYHTSGQLFEFYRALVAPKADSATVYVLAKRDTLKIKVRLGFPPGKEIVERMKKNDKQLRGLEKDRGEFKFLNSKMGYFRFKSFYNCYGKKYEKFLETSFDRLVKKNPKYLVIDLRGNTGGIIQYEFLKYFKAKTEIDRIGTYQLQGDKKPVYSKHFKKNRFYRRRKRAKRKIKRLERKIGKPYDGNMYLHYFDPPKVKYEGEIIVVVDEASFSAATLLAADMKNLFGAKIVGVSPGGSFIEGTAGTLQMKLPNTKHTVIVNPNYFQSSYSKTSNIADIKQPDVVFEADYSDPKKQERNNQKELTKILKRNFR